MDLFSLSWFALVLTGLGTLFILGEILVNMYGLFAILGVVSMSTYFMGYLDTGSFIIMFIIYFIGILLILIDGKFLNDGTLGFVGLISMLLSAGLSAPDFTTGSYAVLGVLLGGICSLFFLKIFKKRMLWHKITLVDRLTSDEGYNSINESYHELIGEYGVTDSDLRPVGTVTIKDTRYSAISDGQWIEKGQKVYVVDVDGTRILVDSVKGNH